MKKMTCTEFARLMTQSPEPLCVDEGCPHHGTEHICHGSVVHPRQAEILKNNYEVFMGRYLRATDVIYKGQCLAFTVAAAIEYKEITGKDINQ